MCTLTTSPLCSLFRVEVVVHLLLTRVQVNVVMKLSVTLHLVYCTFPMRVELNMYPHEPGLVYWRGNSIISNDVHYFVNLNAEKMPRDDVIITSNGLE